MTPFYQVFLAYRKHAVRDSAPRARSSSEKTETRHTFLRHFYDIWRKLTDSTSMVMRRKTCILVPTIAREKPSRAVYNSQYSIVYVVSIVSHQGHIENRLLVAQGPFRRNFKRVDLVLLSKLTYVRSKNISKGR